MASHWYLRGVGTQIVMMQQWASGSRVLPTTSLSAWKRMLTDEYQSECEAQFMHIFLTAKE